MKLGCKAICLVKAVGAAMTALLVILAVCTRVEAGSIVFSQSPVDHSTAQLGDWSQDTQKGEDFILPSGPRAITKIYWWGAYGADPDPAVDKFVFKFFVEDSYAVGYPSDVSPADGTRSPKDYTSANFGRQATTMVANANGTSHDGGTVYAYWAVLNTPLALEGNKRYWVAITNSTPTNGFPLGLGILPNSKWGWLSSSSGSHWRRLGHCPLCQNDWTLSNTTNLAFSMEAMPEIVGYKFAPDGMVVTGIDAIVTAAFTDCFYVRSDDRACAIRVKKTGHTLAPGNIAHIEGSIQTDVATNERYIDASVANAVTGSGTLLPSAMTNKSLGGEAMGLQCGVKDGIGTNNMGMLVRLVGAIKAVDPATPRTWFTLDDGSGVVIKVYPSAGVTVPDAGHYVCVTGVSSCEKAGDDTMPVVRMPLTEIVGTLN